jgi:hypothetical protein
MNKIDIHNYEAYLLDFSEGNLTGDLQMELELFLIQHPELEINLDELSLVTLENENPSFSDKNALKKSENDLVSETQFIAYIENQLPKNERLNLEKSCAINPILEKELALYTNAIASPDTSIVFENKQSLKRKPKVIWFNFSATQYAAAACVLFLVGLFMLWPKTRIDPETSTLANKTDVVISNKIISYSQNSAQATTNTSDAAMQKTSNSLAEKTSIISNKQQPLIATNSVKEIIKTSTIKDTVRIINNDSPVISSPKNEVLIALNASSVVKQKTVVQVITENDDEVASVNTDRKDKGIWATASRLFKNLNHAGVKTVNGDEEENKTNTAYAITLGGVNITHKAGL